MSIIKQYSRISHHTITDNFTFSVPSQEDFTLPSGMSGSWTQYDLALSEIGVNELLSQAFIRIGNDIKEFVFVGTGSNCCSLEDTLITGNTTGLNNIILSNTGTKSTYVMDEALSNRFNFFTKGSTPGLEIVSGSVSTEQSSIVAVKDEIELKSLSDTGITNVGEITIRPTSVEIGTSIQGDPVILQKEYYERHTITTTNSVAVDIFTYSFTTGSVKFFEADLTAVNLGRTEASYDGFFSVIRRDLGGTLNQVSTIDQTTKTEFSTASASFGFTGSTVYCKVSGESGTTINWELNIKYR